MSQANPTDAQIDAYASHYVIHGNQSEAWRQAFPDTKAGVKVHHEKASTFHKLAKVQERIAELREIARKQSQELFGIDAQELKSMLTWAARRGLAGNEGENTGKHIPYDMNASIRAISEINRMDGNHAATRLAMGGDPDGVPLEQQITVVYEHTSVDK